MTEQLTHKRVLKIALPILLANITVPLLGIVDTGVVGQIGTAAPIGAVGLGAVIITAVYWLFGFLRMGTTGLTAQANGEGDVGEVSALLSRGVMIGFGAGLVLIALQIPILWAGFALSPSSDVVEGMARAYISIRIWSAPAAIALYAITGWLIGQERTRAVLVLQLWMNGLNILLDVWFVLGLEWGVPGVAWATFLAEWSALGLGLWLCRDVIGTPDWKDRAKIFNPARLRRMLGVNADIMIRSVLLLAIFVAFTMWSGGLGDVALAANQILLQFLQFTAYALDGFAFAAEALVGRAVGARALPAFRRAVWLSGLWGIVVCGALSGLFWIFGPGIVAILAEAAPVRAEAAIYLPWMVAAPLIGCAAWMLDGIFIGATRTRDMRDMMVVSAAFYFAVTPILMGWLGNHGLWLGILLSFVMRALTLGWKYPALERSVSDKK